MNLCLPGCLCLVHPHLHSLMETWVLLYGSVFHVPVFSFSVDTPCLECVHASVHEFISNLYPTSGPPPMDSYMEMLGAPVFHSMCVPVHLIFVPTPCLEYVHASVHEFMSTWPLMSGPPSMHSLMEIWVPLYDSVFVYQSSHFCCHTLFRMCTCISTWIYIYLTPHIWSTPYG